MLCSDPAKECARSRAHAIVDLQSFIQSQWDHFKKGQQRAKFYSSQAQKSLLYEVTVLPKPGLVDPSGHSTHPDMDVFTFIDSALVLDKCFEECFQMGFNFKGKDLTKLLQLIRPIGIAGEQLMFNATHQINTHKGAIFCLGVLQAASGFLVSHNKEINSVQVLKVVKKMTNGLVENDFKLLKLKNMDNLTIGEKQYLQYGFTGIRGEVESGFINVIKYGLPILRENKSKDLNARLLEVLLNIAAHLSDSNLIKRAHGDEEIIKKARDLIMHYLDQDEVSSKNYQLSQICKFFTKYNLSLGGSADLLIVTIFLGFLDGLIN